MSMFVALDQNGRLIGINEALRGLSCNCRCVACGEPVIARKGAVRGHHFAHYSNKESCFIQHESLLHLYAKEVIRDANGLQLPPLPGISPISEDTSSWWDFEKVEAEVPQDGFQPDMVAHLKDGSNLFVEVAVTSFVGEEKLERIKSARTKTIEIDLRHICQSNLPIPSEEARDKILNDITNKEWLYPETPPFVQQSLVSKSSICILGSAAEQPPRRSEYRFTVMGMWVSARILPTGSVAVRSWSFSPQIKELLKSWRNQLGGEYNPKYKNWVYYPPAANEVLSRLEQLNEQ